MARQSRCVRALVCLVVLLAAACGEDLGPRVPASIVIVPNEPKVPLNQTIQLMATVVDAAGRAMPEEPRTYTSDNPEIVTVSATGLLTAKDFLGSARITVASRGLTAGVFAQAVLPPNAITVAPTTLSLQPTEIFFLSVYVTDDASQLVAVTVTFSSSNTAVATVDGFGQITAVARGLATINVAAPGRESVEVEVVVAQVPTILAVSPTSIVLTPSAVQPLTAEVLDVFGAVVSDAVITFSSSAPAVASVSATGMVRGEADGSAVITIASGDLLRRRSESSWATCHPAPCSSTWRSTADPGASAFGAIGTWWPVASACCTRGREPASGSPRASLSRVVACWTWTWTRQAPGPTWSPCSRMGSREWGWWTSAAAN